MNKKQFLDSFYRDMFIDTFVNFIFCFCELSWPSYCYRHGVEFTWHFYFLAAVPGDRWDMGDLELCLLDRNNNGLIS